MKKDIRYDMSAAPKTAELDDSTYRQALNEAKAEKIDLRGDVSRLHLVELQDDILEWAHGKRRELPPSAEARTVLQLDLPVTYQ